MTESPTTMTESPTTTTATTTTDPTTTAGSPAPEPVIELDAFTRRVMNPLAARLARWGVSIAGSRLLEVRGRRTGQVRATVVNPLDLDGERYLVAPRGVTQWVRNLRAAGTATLRIGRRREQVRATEITDADAKVPVLRAYLERWAWEVGKFFGDLRADSPDDDLRAAATRFPVFHLTVEGGENGTADGDRDRH